MILKELDYWGPGVILEIYPNILCVAVVFWDRVSMLLQLTLNSLVKQGGLNFTEIYLPLPSECWAKGVWQHARLNYSFWVQVKWHKLRPVGEMIGLISNQPNFVFEKSSFAYFLLITELFHKYCHFWSKSYLSCTFTVVFSVEPSFI